MIAHKHDWVHGATIGKGDELQVCRFSACDVLRVRLDSGKNILITPDSNPGGMSPAQHYAEAEKILATDGVAVDTLEWSNIIAEAQVHATLATYRGIR